MIETNPYFSIILPSYNRANFIKKAISSVLQQQFRSWELIVVDDGSVDNTFEVVSSFTDSRIVYVWQNNQERSAARNNGINAAKGEYICFLDSDDEFLPMHLQGLYDFISKHQIKEAFFFTNLCLKQNETIKEIEACWPSHFHDIAFFFSSNIGIIPARWCVHHTIFKKHLFNPNLNISEDVELGVRIVNDFPIIHVNQHSVLYVLHDDNTTNLKNNVFKNRLNVSKSIFRNEIGKNISKLIMKDEICTCYFGIARFHIKRGDKLEAIGFLFKSIIIYPQNRATKHKIWLMIHICKSFFKSNTDIVC
ncbi:MAG: glycosyltransferase [Bacteroidales bacterium]|nr:glycosyltransferase [Bacteroidales bacterium]